MRDTFNSINMLDAHFIDFHFMVSIIFMLKRMAESGSLRSVTKTIISFSSIVLLKYNTVDPSKGFSADIIEIHVNFLRYKPCDAH